MATPGLVVEIIGDDRSMQAAFARASRTVTKFSNETNAKLKSVSTVSVADRFGPLLGDVKKMQGQAEELSEQLKEVGSSGDIAAQGIGGIVAKAGLATAAISAVYSGSRAASEALKTTGEEAFTAGGRLKNLGSALLTADFAGALAGLSAMPKTLDEAGISAAQATSKFERFKEIAEGNSPFAAFAQQAVDLVNALRSAEAAQDSLADSTARLGTAFRDAAGNAATFKGSVDDIGGLRGPGLVNQINTNLEANKFPSFATPQKPIGPAAKNAAAQAIAQAQDDLPEVLRLQKQEQDRLQKALENSTGNVKQRTALNAQLAQATASVIGTQRAIESNAKAAAAAAAAARAAADRARTQQIQKHFADILAGLRIGVDKAGLDKNLNNDVAALIALKLGLQRQIKAGVDVRSAQSQLVAVVGQISSKQQEIQAKSAAAVQANQFRALGLSGSGDEIVPGLENLTKRLKGALSRISSGDLDVGSKIAGRLKAAQKLIRTEGGKLTEETRRQIDSFLKAATGQDSKEKDGPLTATSSLNANKLLEGLGLDASTAKQIKARLSTVNSAGIQLAGDKRPTGAFSSVGGVIVVENHNTTTLDGEVVGRNVTRSQQKQGRRNPWSKRGGI